MTNIYWEEHDHSKDRPKHWAEDLGDAVMNDTESSFVCNIESPPPIVGGYDMTGGNGMQNSIVWNFTKKPNWFHRTCTRFFLGWKWNDKKEIKKKSGLLLG